MGGMGGMALRGGGMMGAGAPGGMLGGAMPMMAEAAMADGMVADAAPMEKRAAGGEAEPADAPAVRQDFADAAFWQANLTTDRQGRAVVRFKMPENLTDWHIGVWSVGDALQVGSGQTSAVTRKRLMVRLQAPRFLIERDRVVLSALVNNDFDTDQSVAVTLEVEGVGELTLEDSSPAEQIVTVPAGSSARVDWSCRAISSGDVTLRVTAIGQLESDAMQTELPIRINGTLKTDSWAGTLAADQDATQVAVRIPEQRLPEQSRLTVRLSPSLALAMLDSLPYLVQYPYGCTEQTLNRFLPTVITHKLLVDMGVDLAALEAARPNLNPQELGDPEQRRQQWGRGSREPVYDAAEVERLVEQGLQRLAQMQLSDGGWGWFSGPIERSGPHTTAVVVRGLLVAQAADVPVVQNVLDRGLDWLANYQNDRLEKLTAPSPERPGVPRSGQPDNIDALVFSVLAEAGRFEPRMQALLFEQRLGLSGYALALLALAADRQGDAEQVAMLRQNLEQFLVEDLENQTAYLRDRSPWWYWYGSPIEANAMYLKLLSRVDPQSATASRLVKYLLNNRKHATYWDSTRDTALVVEAFGDYLAASGEVRRSSRVEVRLGGRLLKSFDFTPETLLTAPNTLELVGVQVPAGAAAEPAPSAEQLAAWVPAEQRQAEERWGWLTVEDPLLDWDPLAGLWRQRLVSNPRLSASYTYGYNPPHLVRSLGIALAGTTQLLDLHPDAELELIGAGPNAWLAAALKQIRLGRAERLWTAATYRANRQEYQAAVGYLDQLIADYDDTSYAAEAEELRARIEDRPADPPRYFSRLGQLFERRDQEERLIREAAREAGLR
jgi:alpha-2-macroglobulin